MKPYETLWNLMKPYETKKKKKKKNWKNFQKIFFCFLQLFLVKKPKKCTKNPQNHQKPPKTTKKYDIWILTMQVKILLTGIDRFQLVFIRFRLKSVLPYWNCFLCRLLLFACALDKNWKKKLKIQVRKMIKNFELISSNTSTPRALATIRVGNNSKFFVVDRKGLDIF